MNKNKFAAGILLASVLVTSPVLAQSTPKEGSLANPIPAVRLATSQNTKDFVFNKDLHTITGYKGQEKNLVLPPSIDGVLVEHIGKGAFDSKSTLESITLPEGLKSIGERALADTGLREVVLPNSLEIIEKSAFTENSHLEKVVLGDKIKELKDNTFAYCAKLKTVTLSANLVKIGKKAFASCNNLETITIPSKLKAIASDAFKGCKKLESILVDQKENALPGAPWGAGEKTQVQWIGEKKPDQVQNKDFEVDKATGTLTKYLGKDASVNVPEIIDGVKITKIGQEAFSNRGDLKHVVLPQGITELEDGAFDNDQFLESIKLSDSLKKIGNHVFDDCSRLKEVNMPKALEYIGDYGFAECAFEEIVLPDTVTHIGKSAFADMVNLKKVTLPKHLKVLEDRVFNASDLEEIVLPQGLEEINDRAFANSKELKKINFPKSLKYIGKNAFTHTGLKEVVLPEGLETIDDYAFGHMNKLEKVFIPKSVTNLSSTAFELSNNLKEIHLAKAKDSLKGAPWGENPAKVFWQEPSLKDLTLTGQDIRLTVGQSLALKLDNKDQAQLTFQVLENKGIFSLKEGTILALKPGHGRVKIRAEKPGYHPKDLIIQVRVEEKAKEDKPLSPRIPLPSPKETPVHSSYFYIPYVTSNHKLNEPGHPLAKKADFKFVLGQRVFKKFIDGKEELVEMDVAPFAKNNRTMLPLRFVAQALGARVEWKQAEQTAYFTKDGLRAGIHIYSNRIRLSNGKEVAMDASPTIKDQRIFVSLTNLSKVFKMTNGSKKDGIDQDIEWNPEDNSVWIKSK